MKKIVLLAEAIFVLSLFLYACISPRQVINVNMASFETEADYTYMEDEILYFVDREDVDDSNCTNVTTEEMKVPSGAYRVDVIYDSYVNENQINEYNANLTMSSRWSISFDSVTLDDQHTQVSGKLWIPLFTGCDDLKINLSYNGNGSLQVKAITLTECLKYRFLRVIGFLLFFAMFDFIIALFYSDRKIKLRKEPVILAGVVAVASLPFFAHTLFGGHDLWFHLLRIASVAEELGNGQFPVRMETVVNNGYGYPMSIYYCDLFLYPAALLYRMSLPLRTCYQIYVLMVNTATTIFTYLALGKLTKRSNIRLFGTALYVLSIYRLVNINVRAAVGEYTAMTFLPLIVAGFYLIYTKDKPETKDWICLAFGMTGVISCHVLTGEMIAINLLLLCFILVKRTFRKDVLLSFVKAGLLCIGLTAWFLIPFLDYFVHQKSVIQEREAAMIENTSIELIYLFQQFSPGKDVGHYLTVGMPLTLGIAMILWGLLKCKSEYSEQRKKSLRVISGFAFLNILFVTKYFPWGRLQKLMGIEGLGRQISTVQFTWRFLSLASMLLVFAVVIVWDQMTEKKWNGLRILSFSMLACIFVSVSFFYYRFTDEVWTASYNIVQPYGDTDKPYLLEGTDTAIQISSTPKVLEGKATICNYEQKDGSYKIYVENKEKQSASIELPIYNYRYFTVYSEDGKKITKTTSEQKCIQINVPAEYGGNVIVKFEVPIFWRIGEGVSLICVGILIVLAVKKINGKVGLSELHKYMGIVLPFVK